MVERWQEWLADVYQDGMTPTPMPTLKLHTLRIVGNTHDPKDITRAWTLEISPEHSVPSHLVIASALLLDDVWEGDEREIMAIARDAPDTVYILMAHAINNRDVAKGLCIIIPSRDQLVVFADPVEHHETLQAYIIRIWKTRGVVRHVNDPVIIAAWSRPTLHLHNLGVRGREAEDDSREGTSGSVDDTQLAGSSQQQHRQ
jgi:hypothetical protein